MCKTRWILTIKIMINRQILLWSELRSGSKNRLIDPNIVYFTESLRFQNETFAVEERRSLQETKRNVTKKIRWTRNLGSHKNDSSVQRWIKRVLFKTCFSSLFHEYYTRTIDRLRNKWITCNHDFSTISDSVSERLLSLLAVVASVALPIHRCSSSGVTVAVAL